MTFEEYCRIEATNWSLLKHMLQSPLAFKHARAAQRIDSDQFRLGRATHTCLLEPHLFEDNYVRWTGGRRQGKAWDEFKASHDGERTILTSEQWIDAINAARAVAENDNAIGLLVGGKSEVTLQWTDAGTGLKLKARADYIKANGACLVDLKTSAVATDPRAFQAAAWRYGYYYQCAFYARGVRAVLGKEPACYIVSVEPQAPYDVGVWQLDEDALWHCDQEIGKLLARLRECIETDKWPGAFDKVQVLGLPRWVGWDDEEVDVQDPSWAEGA